MEKMHQGCQIFRLQSSWRCVKCI